MGRQVTERRDAFAMAERLRELFGQWAKEEAEGSYRNEPSLGELRRALDEERQREGSSRELFPEE